MRHINKIQNICLNYKKRVRDISSSLILLFSGMFLGLVFTFPSFLWPLSLVVFVPVFYVLERRDEKLFKPFAWFFLGYYFVYNLFIFDLLPLSWAFIYDPYYSYFIIILTWFYFTFSISFTQIFLGKVLECIKSYKEVYFIFLFVFFEFLKDTVLPFFIYSDQVLLGPHHSYGSVGYILVQVPILKNIVPYFGPMGAAFLLLVFNFLMYKIFIQGGKKYFYNLLVLLLVLFLLKPNYNGEKSEIYLGNFNLGNDFKFLFSAKDFKGLFEKIPNKNDLIFLPENFKLYEDKELFKEFKIIGTESIFQKQIVYRLENREITPLYEKKLLMPMGEYRIEAFNFLFKYIGGDKWQEFFKQSGSGLKSGESVYNSTEYAYLICGDFLSTYLLNASLKGSKEAILLSSSLRPFNQNYNTEEKLKLYYKMRALESGRYLLLAGYNTESLVVNPYGEIEYSFEAGKNSFSLEKVSFKKNKQKTFYQKILDIFL